MRKLLNTLYITRPNAYLTKEGMNLVVLEDQKEIFRIPIINIENIVTFGYQGASPGCMNLCIENNVGLTFLNPTGRFIARIQGKSRGNVLLRKKQYQLSDDTTFCLNLTKITVAAKIKNCRSVLSRFVRDYGDDVEIEKVIAELKAKTRLSLVSESIDELRGIEGISAKLYFSVFDKMVTRQKDVFKFNGRNRRPPKDEINVMLSFVYMLLTNEYVSALEAVGLDAYIGFMHVLRPGRPSLALDMMEELRAYLCDRLVLTLINRNQITKRDFKRYSEDEIMLTEDGRKKILTAWQEKKKEEITHPFLNEKISLGLLPYVQSMLLARYIRGGIDNYPVFIMK